MGQVHRVDVPDDVKRKLEKVAALIGLESWCDALGLGYSLALIVGDQYVMGNTEFLCCPPKLRTLYYDSPAFFEALCQEGVIEWLTPFVLGKSTTPPEKN
jgi:hypothetical protein